MSKAELPRIKENATKEELNEFVNAFLAESKPVDLQKESHECLPSADMGKRTILAS